MIFGIIFVLIILNIYGIVNMLFFDETRIVTIIQHIYGEILFIIAALIIATIVILI